MTSSLPILSDSNKKYSVHSIFLTLQGEGAHAGRRAVFVRFSGCNVWTGREEDRARDAANNSPCAGFCDTKFFGHDIEKNGGMLLLSDILLHVGALWGSRDRDSQRPFVVLTGGEPSLQVDHALVHGLQTMLDAYVACETNGTKQLPIALDWVTVSPKPPMRVINQKYSEVKVLYPVFNPMIYAALAPRRWVQPVDYSKEDMYSERENREARQACIDFVMMHPEWRVTLQQHKILGID